MIDDVIDDLFPDLAAIALEGAKGVGKTATGSQRATTVLSLDRPGQREIVAADLDYITQVPQPVLIDEWQLEPSVWDRVRRAVDSDGAGGQFLLAGSAGVAPGVRIHSGAGRIVSITMRPLSIAERGLAEPTVSLRELLSGDRPAVRGTSDVGLATYTEEILRSGFPGIRELPERARQVQLDSYLARIVEKELPENGVAIRRPDALRRWLAAYGAASATDTAYTKILDAATGGEQDKPSRATVDSYREHLTRIFVLDPVPAWIPMFNPLKRLTHSPRHHLVDPALAARLVGVGRDGLLRGEGQRVASATGTWLGALFESLVTQSVRIYAEAVQARVGHLRTKETDHEIDLIVESDDREVVAIEVKLAASVGDADVQHLNWLHDQIGDRLVDRVLITAGNYAYRRPDGVAVVPLALLGP
ncbi:ATP-binding protein [Aeromicrobium sp. CTD01-1L150]|uniref:ATP-binding protein n=1 Tax=Aeromicrobium sp. CTD01-1L150 TaxID=3341830 RepID=UPI0035C04732